MKPNAVLLAVILLLMITSGLPGQVLPVQDLDCDHVGPDVLLEWTNPQLYTAIEIQRNDVVVAVLPGNASTFVDVGFGGQSVAHRVFGFVGSAMAPSLQCISGPPPGFRIPGVVTAPGAVVEVRVVADTDFALAGWSMGVTHDIDKATPLEVFPGAAIAMVNDGAGPDFHSPAVVITGSNEGFTVGVVISFTGSDVLPGGMGQEIERVLYEIEVGAPDTISVEFCSCLGNPAVINAVVTPTGESLIPTLTPGVITVADLLFRRGDVTDDGQVALGDAVVLLDALFATGMLTCLAAGDIDGSDVLDLADPIVLLSFLFLSGPPPAAPFPECGPVASGECGEYLSCP